MSKLPETNKNRYLTGMTALNIPLPEEGYGDWHFTEAFQGRGNKSPKFFLAGTGESWDTNPILGSLGIYECSEILRNLGVEIPNKQKVYAADHYRAVADMIYLHIKRKQIPRHLQIDDWFETELQKKELINHVMKIKNHLSTSEQELLNAWLTTI